jgi:hypothetical protein
VAREPQGSSPHSQQTANDPYPEPCESTPYPPNLPKVHFDPILPSTPWSFKWLFSFGFSHQNPVHVSPLSHACHMPCPPHSPWFDLSNNIWWWIQIMKLPTVHLSPFSCYSIPLRSKYPPQHPVLKHPQSMPLTSETKFHTHTKHLAELWFCIF